MEIYVKKEQVNQFLNKCVEEIISIAKKKAEQGITTFYYSKDNYRGRNVSAYEIVRDVENKTNDTVYGGYRSISNNGINFSIRVK